MSKTGKPDFADMGKKLTVEKLECLRCGNKWWPKIKDDKVSKPKNCPNPDCNSPYWDKPRKSSA